MYEESGFLFPCLQWQSFPVSPLYRPTTARSNLFQSTVSEYNLGGEGDLFKAPEAIMEEPLMGLDPMTLVSMINSDEDITTTNIEPSDAVSIQTGHLLSETSALSECTAGGEGDLFKAPVSVMEEPLSGYDPTIAAISMISSGKDAISTQMVKAAEIESFESDHLQSEVLYKCEKDLVEKSTLDESFSKVLDIKVPAMAKEEDLTVERKGLITGSPMQKSVSSHSLSTIDWIKSGAIRPSFLDFETVNLGAATGMRRAFSEGDIQDVNDFYMSWQRLHSGNALGHSPFEKTLTISNYTSEDRMLRLSRYRIKKKKRNFSRKIKYACRKALADNQPRVRGRFAKTEETSV